MIDAALNGQIDAGVLSWNCNKMLSLEKSVSVMFQGGGIQEESVVVYF